MLCALCKKEIIGTQYKTRKRKRYHNDCFEKLVEEADTKSQQKAAGIKNKDKESLLQYICHLYGIKEIPYVIDKQIDSYVSQLGYTYSGIQKALYYFYELEKNKADTHTSTIGIVPYCYDEARKFFETIHESNEVNKDFIKEDTTVHVKIRPKDRRIPYIIDINSL